MMSQSVDMFADGAAYERLMGQWSKLVGEEFLRWLDLPNGLVWLDAGCGNGAFTEVIFENAAPARLVGIDPADAQIAFARSRPALHSVEFNLGDAHSLQMGDAVFDVSTMALVISFLRDPAQAVAELLRVVRPGGMVATYMWDITGGGVPVAPIYKALAMLGHPPPHPPNPAISAIAALRDLWQTCGLEAVETTIIRVPVSFSDFEDFWASNTIPVGPLGMFLESLTVDVLEEARKMLRQQLPVQPDGGITYDAIANAVKGRKPG